METPPPATAPSWLAAHRADLRHGLRVGLAAAVSFGVAAVFRLPQGYWAVITAVVVVQTSIGATLGASRDRLIGTGAGAVVGALAAGISPPGPWGEAAGLLLSVGLLGLGAALRPSLKIAPVTAVIMIVGAASSHQGFATAAGLRVAEIAVGGVIGVLVALFVFPARARDAVAANSVIALRDLATVLRLYGRRLNRDDVETAILPLQAKIRTRLGAIETLADEAAREAAARLTGARVPDSIPRTLWRLRNDTVMIGRASSHDWTGAVADRLGPAAADLLGEQARALEVLADALAAGARAPPPDLGPGFAAFRQAFQRLEDETAAQALGFERLEQIFGLAYALEALNRNAADLADRLGEFVERKGE